MDDDEMTSFLKTYISKGPGGLKVSHFHLQCPPCPTPEPVLIPCPNIPKPAPMGPDAVGTTGVVFAGVWLLVMKLQLLVALLQLTGNTIPIGPALNSRLPTVWGKIWRHSAPNVANDAAEKDKDKAEGAKDEEKAAKDNTEVSESKAAGKEVLDAINRAADSARESLATMREIQDAMSDSATKIRDEINSREQQICADLRDLEKQIRADMRDLEKQTRADLRNMEKQIRANLRDLEEKIHADLKNSANKGLAEMKAIRTDCRSHFNQATVSAFSVSALQEVQAVVAHGRTTAPTAAAPGGASGGSRNPV